MTEITLEQLKEKQQNNEKILVDWYAPWCGPCKALGTLLNKIEPDNTGLKFYKINIDTCKEYAVELGIRSIPCVMLYNGDEIVDRYIGVHKEGDYNKAIKNLLGDA